VLAKTNHGPKDLSKNSQNRARPIFSEHNGMKKERWDSSNEGTDNSTLSRAQRYNINAERQGERGRERERE
jgi:hypothetical protein